MNDMNAAIRRAAGRDAAQTVDAAAPTAEEMAQAQEIAEAGGMTLTEALATLRGSGPVPVPPGHAGAGTGPQPAAPPDMNTFIRQASANKRRKGR
jgi:hypothetical protein